MFPSNTQSWNYRQLISSISKPVSVCSKLPYDSPLVWKSYTCKSDCCPTVHSLPYLLQSCLLLRGRTEVSYKYHQQFNVTSHFPYALTHQNYNSRTYSIEVKYELMRKSNVQIKTVKMHRILSLTSLWIRDFCKFQNYFSEKSNKKLFMIWSWV